MLSRLLTCLALIIVTVTCVAIPTRVVRVIDGDTFETETGEKVRMIGINAPEAQDVNGPQATRHLKDLIEGKDVELVPDGISSERDGYQRLLRYVEIGTTDINLKMVQDGFAFAYLKYKFARSEAYRIAQVQATEGRIGMWGTTIPDTRSPDEADAMWSLSAKAWLLVGLVAMLICMLAWSLLRR